MKNWKRFVSKLGAYNYNSTREDKDKPDYKIPLDDNLSPTTNIFLDLFSNLITEKNLILSFPDNVLKPIPILAHIFANNQKKSVLIFTSHHKGFKNRNVKEFHNLNYCMLYHYGGSFVFYTNIIGAIRKGILKTDIKFPKSSGKKQMAIEKQNLIDRLEMNEPKILLFTEDNLDIIEEISEVQIDSKLSTLRDSSIDLGLVIFENVDLYVNSKYTAERFLKWISNYLGSEIKFLFHFSNPNSKFINLVKNKTHSFLIPFNKNLLLDSNLLPKSQEYYSNLDNFPKRKQVIQNYNLDSKSLFKSPSSFDKCNVSVVKPLLASGNFQSLYGYGKSILRNIDQNNVVNKRLFRVSRKLFYSFLDLSVSPLGYKVKYCVKNGDCKHLRLTHFLDIFKKNLYKENDSSTQSLLNDFIDCLMSITFELGKSRHYGEKNSFNRIGKEYKILDIANNKKKYFGNDKDVIICCYNSGEVALLNEKLIEFNISGVIVKNIHWLHKSLLSNKEDYNLLLPGAVPLRYFSELFMPYDTILIVSYEGYCYEKISKQIESIEYINKADDQFRIESFKEMYTFLDYDDDTGFIESIDKNIEISTDIDKEFDDESFDEDYISIMIKDIFKSSKFNEDFEISEKIEKEIEKDNRESIETEENSGIKSIKFKLKNVETGNIVYKRLPLNKSYNYLNDKSEFLEGFPKLIKEGNFLIFVDGNDKKRLLDVIVEIYDLDMAVDKNSIEYWKNKVMDFFIVNNFNYSSFNKKFNEIGGDKTIPATSSWVKGEVIGPQNPNDLFLLGKLIGDELLMENYRFMFQEIEKIRTIHRLTGKRVNAIVKSIVNGKDSIDHTKLGYTGQLFYDKVKQGIYEVIEKTED